MQLDPAGMTPTINRIKRALDKAGFAIVATGLQQCLTNGDGLDSVDVKQMEKLCLSLA